MKKATVAVITYNSFPPYKDGNTLIEINDVTILILAKIFNPKRPESVAATDFLWQELLKHKDTLEKIFIFAGKKDSGALEIIDLACQTFNEILFFILCDHELDEKLEKLFFYGIKEEQYVSFKDGYLPCREGPLLKGYLYEYVKT